MCLWLPLGLLHTRGTIGWLRALETDSTQARRGEAFACALLCGVPECSSDQISLPTRTHCSIDDESSGPLSWVTGNRADMPQTMAIKISIGKTRSLVRIGGNGDRCSESRTSSESLDPR